MKIVLILLFLLVVLLVPGMYWYAISGGELKLVPLSGKNQDWAALGSYIGGLLGPILSAASILFVWWQSKEATANQQEQIKKINEQLGLEKQNLFREEFNRLFQRAVEEGEITMRPTYTGVFYDKILKSNTKKQWSRLVKYKNEEDSQNLVKAWRELSPYLSYVMEIANLLSNRANEFGMEEVQLQPYIRQFQVEFYLRKGNKCMYLEKIKSLESIHGFTNLEKAFDR